MYLLSNRLKVDASTFQPRGRPRPAKLGDDPRVAPDRWELRALRLLNILICELRSAVPPVRVRQAPTTPSQRLPSSRTFTDSHVRR